MKRTIGILLGFLMLGGLAAAQEGLYEYPAFADYGYGYYGDVGYGEYSEIGDYDEEEVGYPYGNLLLTTDGPSDQAIDVVITGPNGYSDTFESEAGAEVEIIDLPVGVYSIAATDDNLEMVHALVEVRLGQAVAVVMNLAPFEAFAGEIGEGYGLEAGYYGVEEELGDEYEPYGLYSVEGYEAYDNEEAGAIQVFVEGVGEGGEAIGYEELGVEVEGHIVGPDDERTEIDGEETEFEDLPAGIYSISATAEGYGVAHSYLQVQPGQTALVRVSLVGLGTLGAEGVVGEGEGLAEAGEGVGVAEEEGLLGAEAGVGAGLFEEWDADADDALVEDEFETGFFGTLAGDDAELDEGEFGAGAEAFGLEGEFADYDVDADAVVTEAEFVEVYDAGLYEEWDVDADATLTLDEYNRGWFGVLDANDDEIVDEEEYGLYGGWFGYDYEEFEGYEDGLTEEEWLGFGV